MGGRGGRAFRALLGPSQRGQRVSFCVICEPKKIIKFFCTRIALNRDVHTKYLRKITQGPLPAAFTALDASQPWICYWTVHSMLLLGIEIQAKEREMFINTCMRCWSADGGGFGGGNGQLAHLAPTYAAVMALVSLGKQGYEQIDRYIKCLLIFTFDD